VVFSADGSNLDDMPCEGHTKDVMYLDPYRTDVEVPIEHLRTQLTAWGIRPDDFSAFLGASKTSNIVLRTSRNILATVHEFRGHGGEFDNTGHPTIRLHANPFADMDNAFYSALWANFILSNRNPSGHGNNQRQFIPMILESFEKLYPVDASLIERYVLPPFSDAPAVEHAQLHQTLHIVRTVDAAPKNPKPRNTVTTQTKIKYKVGQVFRHRRYGYHAVITGWDVECGMNSQWIAHNNVDALSKGRHQSFYHAL
jgi:F-box protein 21